MSQIIPSIRRVQQSELMFRLQLAFNAAFAAGSLSAAVINLCALLASSVARSATPRHRDYLPFQA
jgi:hypothetical protein